MPISINYDPDQNALFTNATGEISLEDIMRYYSEIEQMDFKPQYSVLADYSEARAGLALGDISKMTSRRYGISFGLGVIKIAVVAKSDLLFGLARMYQGMIDHKLFEVSAFRDRREALRWLKIFDAPA